MSATRSGVTADPQRIAVAKKAAELSGVLLSDRGVFSEQDLLGMNAVFQALTNKQGFTVKVMKPKTFSEFLQLENPTQGGFNQLVSEVPFWKLLDQIEAACFLQSCNLKRARPFLSNLWQDKIGEDPYRPPKDWRYLSVEEAVERFRNIFGSSLKAESTLKRAKEAKPGEDTEGVAVWPKLSVLGRILDVSGDPLAGTEEGRKAYARIVELFIPEVGKQFVDKKCGWFKNWIPGNLTADRLILTPAGLFTWRELESRSEDDFVLATAGANSGSWYAGHTIRASRLCIVLASNLMPQDCIMAGGTIAIQPERMSHQDHLGIDCPGNAYAETGCGFGAYPYWWTNDGTLQFGGRTADVVILNFGAAVLRRP